jgi:hypothetical protein
MSRLHWKRETAGVYSATVNGADLRLVHQPECGGGYQWMAESPDQGTPDFSGATKAEVTAAVERHFGDRRPPAGHTKDER